MCAYPCRYDPLNLFLKEVNFPSCFLNFDDVFSAIQPGCWGIRASKKLDLIKNTFETFLPLGIAE